MAYKKISNILDLAGKRVLLRVDFNVPVADGNVVDDFRIRKVLPTITFLKNAGARIILLSHIESGSTLKPVFEHIKAQMPIEFCQDCLEDASLIKAMKDGDIVLCENLRLYSGEKTNDPDFAKHLASLGDLYINEAFSVSHRKHASVARITEFLPSFAGNVFDREVQTLSESFHPPQPSLFILGGAKFDTKIPLITKFSSIVSKIFVGGALAHNFFKEQGNEIGQSLFSEGDFHLESILAKGNIIVPVDSIVERDGKKTAIAIGDCKPTENMIDDGPSTLEILKKEIAAAKFILWNGPLGNYEKGFKEGTEAVAEMIAASGTRSIVGGGDTLATINELHLEDKFGFVSTAGGAMLDFLAEGTLPGIIALEKSK